MRLTCAELENIPDLEHGFLGRKGGVSKGIYSSLNCGPGSDDTAENVAKNRQLALKTLNIEASSLCTLYQIHSNNVVTVTEPWTQPDAPQADAMVTKTPNIALGILTADCAPVLFTDPNSGIIGAAHAGWKGALKGILENTVNAMAALGASPSNISAAIGPCIGKDSYQVGPEFKEEFATTDIQNEIFFSPSKNKGRFMFDLPRYVMNRLQAMELAHIGLINQDTVSAEEHFFSYRRSTLNHETDYGRQLSVICLRD